MSCANQIILYNNWTSTNISEICIKVEFGYVSTISCNFCNGYTLEFFQLYKFKCFKMQKNLLHL